MTLIISSLIFAALMILITKIPVAIAQIKLGGYNNELPRKQQAALSDFGLRALGAHQNTIEAFPVFAAGVGIALWAQSEIATVQTLCIAFVSARILFSVCYWMNWDKVRSVMWAVGFISSIWLMALPLNN